MPFFGQTIFNIVHWTANIFAICVLFPEMDCERNLGKLGTHAEKSRAPHPENCAGTAEGNRARNACDVAGADRACKRGTDCLERAHGAVLCLCFVKNFTDRVFHGSAEFAHLNEAGTDRKQKSYADDADHCGDAPDKSVDRLIDFDDTF